MLATRTTYLRRNSHPTLIEKNNLVDPVEMSRDQVTNTDYMELADSIVTIVTINRFLFCK